MKYFKPSLSKIIQEDQNKQAKAFEALLISFAKVDTKQTYWGYD